MTSPARVGRMLAIMLGICLIGGIIFFSMWDYWISEPPPVVAVMAGDNDHADLQKQLDKQLHKIFHFLNQLTLGL